MHSHNVDTNLPKHCQISKILVLLQAVDVTENEGDNKVQTGSRNSAISAHAQNIAKMAVNAS